MEATASPLKNANPEIEDPKAIAQFRNEFEKKMNELTKSCDEIDKVKIGKKEIDIHAKDELKAATDRYVKIHGSSINKNLLDFDPQLLLNVIDESNIEKNKRKKEEHK